MSARRDRRRANLQASFAHSGSIRSFNFDEREGTLTGSPISRRRPRQVSLPRRSRSTVGEHNTSSLNQGQTIVDETKEAGPIFEQRQPSNQHPQAAKMAEQANKGEKAHLIAGDQQRQGHGTHVSTASSTFLGVEEYQPQTNLVELDMMPAEAPRELVSCSSIEVLSEGGTIEGTADLCLHPVEHADALLSAQEAQGPRHGIRAFQEASQGGRRHVLMLPVNAIVRGLNQVSMNDPLLEGWMGISPAELARYMLWSGYDTLLLQQVPAMQATSGLGRWKMLEGFTEGFARAWEEESTALLGVGEESRGMRRRTSRENDLSTPGSRGSQAEGGFGFYQNNQTVPASQRRLPMISLMRRGDSEEISEKPFPIKREATTVVNPMMTGASRGGLLAGGAGGGDVDSATIGHAGFWLPYIRVHTANLLVENGDAFVHHAFMSRDVEHPWWYSIKGIVLRNRHLDVKGLYSHSYASEVYKSRTQIVTFIEGYVEDEGAEELEEIVKENKSLWGISRGASLDVGRGRRLAMFAIEEVDASVNIDPIDPPAAFRRVAVGEEFSEADALLPRPFSSVDIGHFLTVMQTKSIPALVCFSLPPALSDLKVFREKQEPISMVQYLSTAVFCEYEPNMPRVARKAIEPEYKRSIVKSASAVITDIRAKGVRWADQQHSKKEDTGLDPLTCPNLDAFLDAVTTERKRTGAVEWSAEGEEEADWIEAVVEQLRTAKKSASKINKARTALAAQTLSKSNSGLFEEAPPVAEEDDGFGDIPEWVTQQLPDLLRLLEACRLLVHDSTLLQTMVDASHRVNKRRKGDSNTPGATPSRSQTNTPNRSRANTPNRSRAGTPGRGGGLRTPGGREIEDDEDELLRTYEEEPLPLHWTDVDKLGKADTLHDTETAPELLEDQMLSAYLEYSVGQPRLGTRSSVRAQEIVLNNVQFLIDSGSLTPVHFETSRCGPVKSDIFKSILAKFSAIAIMLQSSRKGNKEKDPAKEGKEFKDIKAAVHALLSWVSVSQVYACMSAVAVGGGADVPTQGSSGTAPMSIEVFVVERQVLTFTGEAESEEHYAFHSLYKETAKGLAIYVTKEHKNIPAGVLWCYLKAMGVPVMICHLAECLMDRTLDCRWDNASNDELFKLAALKQGVIKLGYVGELRPLNFLSETCRDDIQDAMPILERACLLRMLAHGHGCLAEYSAAGPSKAKSRSELAASFRIVSTWRLALVQNLRSMPSSRYLNKFEEHLRLPRLTIVGAVIGHRGVDPRRVLWWTWLAVPWSPSARAAIINLLTVINRAPPPRVSAAAAAESTPLSRSMKRKSARAVEMAAAGGAALNGQQEHGALWRMISDLLVTRLGTCMLVRSLVLENRDESPYPPNEKHYHMVALELRGADKTAVFEYLRTDPGMLGEVLNRLVREDCLAADHSAAFLDSKSLGTLHNVKHGRSGNEPIWLQTGYGGRLKRFRDALLGPKDSPVVHGYSVGMYYSMPVLIELLMQLTSNGKNSIYTNSALDDYEAVVPMALLHSLVIFGGLSLGAAKISSVNYFSFMVIKLVLAQVQFMAVLIVCSVILLPFVAGASLLLWWENPFLAATFTGVFFFVGVYIMLVSLMLSTTGGKPWSSNSGRTLLLAHGFLLVSPTLTRVGIIPEEYGSESFIAGVGVLLLTLLIGFTVNTRRLYNMTLSKQLLTLTTEEWKEWQEDHKDHPDPTVLFYQKASGFFTALQHRLTRKRRFRMMDEDLEQFLLGFDAIRSAQAVPPRWSKSWDERLTRGHEALVAVNRGAGVETASTMWAVVKWDVLYGAAYFMMVFSDNLVSIWTEKSIVQSDEVNTLALALFIVATAGLESMMMVNLGRTNGWRFWRMDPEVLSMSDASRSVSNALHKLYLWDFASYTCFVLMCTLAVCCLGYFWLVAGMDWKLITILRAISLVVGYMGILIGLFHKILFGGSVSRQKASVKVSAAALGAGYGLGLGLVAANNYLHFSSDPVAFAALGFTGFFYAVFSMYVYGEFRVQLTSQGFASGQLLSTPSLGTAGQRCLGVATLHLDGMEARATESCRAASGGRILTQIENRELIRRTLFSNNVDPSSLWTSAPRSLRAAFGNKVPRNDDFFRWTISPVPDRCILDHGLNALVDPEQDDLLYVAESIYADRQAFMECLLHETYEWAYGSHQVGVLAELLRDPLPTRMRRQVSGEECRLPMVVDRTLPCSVDVISVGCLKNEMYWRDLSPHARELVIRMVLMQPPAHFRHVENNDHSGLHMQFEIDDEEGHGGSVRDSPGSWVEGSGGGIGAGADPYSDLALAIRLGCRNGNVLVAAMEEASLGLEPQVVVARAALLSGLSQCVMRYALAHISANPTDRDGPGGLSRYVSVGHLQGRQRVWGAMANAHNLRIGNAKKYGRLSNVEALLGEVETVFPPRGAFHLDYMLFGAASGCMGFDREAFALMLDQNPRSLQLFIKLHRVSHWLYKKLLYQMVLKTDPLISELMKTIDSADLDGVEGFGEPVPKARNSAVGEAEMEHTPDPENGVNWLIEQRKSLEGMIRDQDLPIAFSQWIDQRVLRREPLLADYWEARDAGHFSEALVSLKLVESDLAEGLNTGTPAGLSTYADLATFAKCGSTIGMMRATREGEGAPRDTRNGGGCFPGNIKADGGVCVIAMDSGTWPLYGGGVAVCRKQLLDDTVGRVRWNTLFEVALPAPLPKTVDTPENIRQILPIPLWSQNAGGAYESFLAHTSFITRASREQRTTNTAINTFFIPQLKTLIDLANTPGESVSVGGLEVAAAAIAEIYAYFQVFDWETTWKAGTTHDHWAASWLACAARDKQAGPLLKSEKPNLAELHEILNYWQTLLTCLQVQLPEMNPENRGVIHVSHHGTQALVGIAAKRLNGWGLVVWDHGMLWRERCKAIAELHSSSLFVRKSLISLHRLVAKVTLYEADTLTPCTQMNKPWEMRCVAERDSEVRDLVSRKVNPVLNGAPASITPNEFLEGLNADNKNEWVTTVMLSHVYALKGVMTAIQAADIIVHRYGMKKFRLLIYGSMTHDVVYCRRCEDAIERLKLSDNVWLKGKGRPAAVLAQGDMFLNSSVSEGLPLAIIEASRAGLVVVATDVGGTRDVVGEFGGVCRPNSPLELAKTQLETLAACQKWCKIAGAPNLAWGDIDLSPNPCEILEKAIFNKDVINARHDWGTRYLEWTSKAFTLDRYRDEHVRALWYADRQAMGNCARLDLDWGPDPGQKRLAVSFLRLRRLLDVSDRKEHTNLSFISSFSEARARIKSELKSRTPIQIPTDPGQLAQMSAFQTVTADLPLLQWLHGGKSELNEWQSELGDGMSVVSGMSGMLHRIDESEYEESSVGSIARRPVPPGMGSRTESSSTFTTDHDRSSANTEGPQGLDAVRIPDDSAMGHGTGVTTILAGDEYGGIAAGGKRNSLGRKAEAGTSPGVSKSYAKGIAGNRMGDVSRAWDGKTENKAGALGRVQGPSSPGSESTSTASGDDQTEAGLQRKLEKLHLFEELDRRLVERVGVHLTDVGDLSSPALAKILHDTAHSPGPFQRYSPAPSPAASANAKAPKVTGKKQRQQDDAAGQSMSYGSDASSLAGINLANVASPAASLTSLLSGGPLEPPVMANGVRFGASDATGRAVGSGNLGSEAVRRYLSGSELTVGAEESPAGDSPAGSPTSSRGGSSVVSAARQAMHSASSLTSPVAAWEYGNAGGITGSGSRQLSAGETGHAIGASDPAAEATVEVSDGRSWVPSPISAVGMEGASAPWDSENAGQSDQGGGDGRGGDAVVPGGKYQFYNSGNGSERSNSWRRHEEDSSFDEEAFEKQEKKLRSAFMQRMGSLDSSTADGGSVSSLPRWGSGDLMQAESGKRAAENRKGYALNNGLSDSAISNATLLSLSSRGSGHNQRISSSSRERIPRGRRSKIDHVMHPRQESPPAVASVSIEVRKARAAKRQHLIKAMATSQHLSAASSAGGSSLYGSGSGLGSSVRSSNSSGRGGGGSGLGLGSGPNATGHASPPETERPLPYVRDVLAKQGPTERGIKRFENPGQSGQSRFPPRGQAGVRRRVEQAAANFAAEDSADEDSDESGSRLSAQGHYVQ